MVAATNERIVAVRPFMRWRFRRGSETLSAVRAVDTATRPEARGKGLFRKLTETGIEVLREESLGIIFNTPNDQSRPGYLKMGWREAGRIPIGFRLRSIAEARRLPGARVAAEKLSQHGDFGIDVAAGLATSERNLGVDTSSQRWATDHDLATLRWRFTEGPVEYRWLPGPDSTGIIVRVRRRGTAKELFVAATVGQADVRARAAAVELAWARSNATYCLAPVGFPKTIALKRLGPALTVRSVTREPEPDLHDWQPGDLELF